jgi:hypothetical protein
MMFLGVADFHMPDEESRKLSGHLIIKLCKRTYVVVCDGAVMMVPENLIAFVDEVK